MTMEGQAEEYIKKEYCEGCMWEKACNSQCEKVKKCKQDFYAGIRWGMEHATEWHDLRKNPNDLPKLEDKGFSWSIIVANQLGEACHYNYKKSCWETPLFTEIEGVIKWCELPTYKE